MKKSTRNPSANSLPQPTARNIMVRVPASAGNLGPGFDTLGLALNLHNDYIFRQPAGAEKHEVFVGGAAGKKKMHQALVVETLAAVGQRAGAELPPAQVEIHGEIPPGVGLGASAATRVAAALAANLWLGNPFSWETLLALVIGLEGHPDNAAPAMCGGLTVTMLDDRGPLVNLHKPHPDWRYVFLVPDYAIDTEKSRGKLAKKVAREDAVFNLSRLPFVVEALVAGEADGLDRVVRDRLHEPVRAAGIKRLGRMREAALEAGAAGVFISGSGPALGAICHGTPAAGNVAHALETVMQGAKFESRTYILEAAQSGARIAEMD